MDAVPVSILALRPSTAEPAPFLWSPTSGSILLLHEKVMTGSWCTTNGRHLSAVTSESKRIFFLRLANTTPPSSGMFVSTWLWCWSTWPVGICRNNSFYNQIFFLGGDSACLPCTSFYHPVSTTFVITLCPSFPRIMQVIHRFFRMHISRYISSILHYVVSINLFF